MSWGIVAGAAVTVVGGMVSQNSANKKNAKAAEAQNRSAYLDYTNNVNAVMENNRAIGEANTANQIRTGYKVGLLNLQTAKLKEQAARDGWGIGGKGMEALSNADANAGASGVTGASVDAVALDIKRKAQNALISVDIAWEDQREEQGFALHGILEQGADVQRSVQAIPDIASVNLTTADKGSLLGAGAGALLNSYASGALRFSAGSSGGAQTGITGGAVSFGSGSGGGSFGGSSGSLFG